MRAVISSTNDPMYCFFIPIVTWCWNRLGVDVVTITPENRTDAMWLAIETPHKNGSRWFNDRKNIVRTFAAPTNKQATYAQVSRLYAAAIKQIEPSELLVISDVDMAVFKDLFGNSTGMRILGTDLTPKGQFPMCYAWASAAYWRQTMQIHSKTLQECLDHQLAHEECENMRGNLWSRDQELLYKYATAPGVFLEKIERARAGTQFAIGRLDRDDAYMLDRIHPGMFDYHMHRPGYTDENFQKILRVLQYFNPQDNFGWLENYRREFLTLIP